MSIERLLVTLDHGSAPRQVIVLAADDPEALAMPAAGLAAESGAPILFVTRSRVPVPTFNALAGLNKPSIYVIDPSTVGPSTLTELRHYGHVSYITRARAPSAGDAAVQNAIEVARYTDGTFGWGVKEPGHGLVFANAGRPLDAPASALLSATGDYGPLLLLASADELPQALVGYLSDIEPAYTSAPQFQPVRGVYNHGWLIGDEHAISAVIQAEIDSHSGDQPAQPDLRRIVGLPSRIGATLSQAEDPRRVERKASTNEVTIEDVRQLMGASTPHFALQLRNRIANLIAGLPPEHPARVEGEREIARLQRLGFDGETRGEGAAEGERAAALAELRRRHSGGALTPH